MQKVALIVLDGFGITSKAPEQNAITVANTPIFNDLFAKRYTALEASGRAVGLPAGQMGNSEVGHMTIGTGRIIKQNLVEIEDMLNEGSFAKLPAFLDGIAHCRKHSSNLHMLQLFGPGGVHAMDTHLQKIIALLPTDIQVYLHLFTDGRDLPPQSALELMDAFEVFLLAYPHVKIASIGGRYYGMDRDNNRERVQKSYDEMVFGQLQTSDTPSEYIAKQYEQAINDEFIIPVSFIDAEQITAGDAVFHLNFRSDRGRQMTQALMVSKDPQNAKEYPTRSRNFGVRTLPNLYIATMTKYYKEYNGPLFVKESDIKHTLGEVIASHEARQLHIAETEKFAHVTKFLNGDKQIVYDGEKDILVPSHKVATYDLDPEMSAQEILDAFVANANDYNFVVINFANGDMVGHTWILSAAVQAVKKLASCVETIIDFCKHNDFDLLITADHGNCEEMGSPEAPMTAHTMNKVPLWYIQNGKIQQTVAEGGLSDIAPTVLSLMGIAIPAEMTGKNLVVKS